MIETIGFGLIAAVSGALKFALFSTAKNVVNTAFESSVGEAVEEFFEAVVSGEFVDFFKKFGVVHKVKEEKKKELESFYKTLNDNKAEGSERYHDVQEFIKFFRDCSLNSKMVDSLKAQDLDLDEKADGKEGLFKRVSFFLKKPFRKRAFDKKIWDALTERVDFLKPEDVIDRVFVIDGNKPKSKPVLVCDLISILIRYTYELMYVKMSSEDRTFAKIIQYMLEKALDEKEDRLLEAIRGEIACISQLNVSGEMRVISTGDGKIAKKNLWVYVPMVCPVCGADGGNVVKHEGRIYCKCCNRVHEQIRGVDDPEIKKLLDDVLKQLVEHNENKTRDIIAEIKARGEDVSEQLEVLSENTELGLKRLSESIVSKAYFDTKLERLAGEINKMGCVTASFLKVAEEENKVIAASVKSELASIKNYLEASNKDLNNGINKIYEIVEKILSNVGPFPPPLGDNCVEMECPACGAYKSHQQQYVGLEIKCRCNDCGTYFGVSEENIAVHKINGELGRAKNRITFTEDKSENGNIALTNKGVVRVNVEGDAVDFGDCFDKVDKEPLLENYRSIAVQFACKALIHMDHIKKMVEKIYESAGSQCQTIILRNLDVKSAEHEYNRDELHTEDRPCWSLTIESDRVTAKKIS